MIGALAQLLLPGEGPAFAGVSRPCLSDAKGAHTVGIPGQYMGSSALQVAGRFRSDRDIGAVCNWPVQALVLWITARSRGSEVLARPESAKARIRYPEPGGIAGVGFC